jgi:hypothetical protein
MGGAVAEGAGEPLGTPAVFMRWRRGPGPADTTISNSKPRSRRVCAML